MVAVQEFWIPGFVGFRVRFFVAVLGVCLLVLIGLRMGFVYRHRYDSCTRVLMFSPVPFSSDLGAVDVHVPDGDPRFYGGNY